jgi:hypothetical protein
MERTATRTTVRTARQARRRPAVQAIRGLRAHGARLHSTEPTGSVELAFEVTFPVESATVWVQSSTGFDVLTYRHFTAATPARRWNVTVPDLPAGTYDVTVDVPWLGDGGRESWSGQVQV